MTPPGGIREHIANIRERIREYLRPFYLRHFYFPLRPDRKPKYFDQCWGFPDYRDRGAATNGKPVLVFLPMNDWHARMQRTQHLALAMSRLGYRCLYLNPHLGREFPRGYRSGESERTTELTENVLEIHVHLPREPVFHHRRLTGRESGLVAEAIDRQLIHMGVPSVVQIVALPVWLDAAEILRRRRNASIVYDCHDYLPGFAGIAPEIVRQEAVLFQTSDMLICSAASLMERARQAGVAPERCRLLRNAASPELLEIQRRRAVDRQVVVGYIGALDAWFDVESVRTAAHAHSEWRFQLVGRVENDQVRALATLPNVELAGEIPFDSLGRWLAHFSVAVIPFVINPLIRATDPIKLYEYFAAGLPVVASEIPELARFGDLLLRYADPQDFVRKLEQTLVLDGDAGAEARRDVARRETWDARAAELDQWLSPARKD